MKHHKVIFILPPITAPSAVLHACSRSLARSHDNKRKKHFVQSPNKRNGYQGLTLPHASHSSARLLFYHRLRSLVAPLTVRILTDLSTEISPETLSFYKAMKDLTSACRAASSDLEQRVHLVDGYGSVGFYPGIPNQLVLWRDVQYIGRRKREEGRAQLIATPAHMWESNLWASSMGPIETEAIKHPHDRPMPIPGSPRERRLARYGVRGVGIDVVAF